MRSQLTQTFREIQMPSRLWKSAHEIEMVAQWETEIDALVVERDKCLFMADAAESNIAALRIKVASLTNANAAVSSLPVETLAAIFNLATSSTTIRATARRSPEVVISHVSSRWRHIALTTASLWTTITLSLPNYSSWFYTYLARSQKMPITLTMQLKSPVFPNYPNYFPGHFKILDDVAHRLCRLEVKSDTRSYMVALYEYWRHLSLPLLQYLHLGLGDLPREGEASFDDLLDDVSNPGSLFKEAPAIRTLSLNYFAFEDCVLPTSSITHLHISTGIKSGLVSPSAFVDFLSSFPLLTHLHLEGDLFFEGQSLSSEARRIKLPNLTHLRIASNVYLHHDPIVDMLNVLHAPSLTYLDLEADDHDVISFLSNKNSPDYSSLKTLIVPTRRFFDNLCLEPFARKFPTVTTVHLGQIEGGQLYELFDPEYRMIHTHIWENLTTLTISPRTIPGHIVIPKTEYNTFVDINLLLDLVILRSDAGYPIRKIRVSNDIMDNLMANAHILALIRAKSCDIELSTDSEYEDPFCLSSSPWAI